jgi:hypothetical protein
MVRQGRVERQEDKQFAVVEMLPDAANGLAQT